jgi:hypothetical protein
VPHASIQRTLAPFDPTEPEPYTHAHLVAATERTHRCADQQSTIPILAAATADAQDLFALDEHS